MAWTVETLNAVVDAEIEALPEDMRARLVRISLLIEQQGLERVGAPHVKHLESPLWEIRLKGRSGISRPLCDGNRPARDDRPCLHEENREDPTPRDRAGAEPGARGAMMEVEHGTGS